jgi:hypothetical protein
VDSWRISPECGVPWKTGLPWLSRLTIYGADGKSRGHLRQWSWDDVIFRRELKLISPTKDGITVFRAEKSFALGQSAVRAGEMLVARWPDANALVRVEKVAANDVIYFRLPDAAGEDFAGASKSIGDPQARERIMEFASLAEAAAKGQPQEKAQAMVALGDAFEAAWKRSRKNADETFSQGGASLVLRENGHALGFTNLFEDLTLFYQVPGLPKEARDEYIQL